MCLFPFWVFSHLPVGITISMRFLICLIHHIDAIAVTEFIQIGTIWIVRGAQEIDICLLHQLYILLISGIIHKTTCTRVMVMSVHSSQLHILSIDLEYPTNNLYFLHSKMIVEMLQHLTCLVQQLQTARIEMGLFCRPQAWMVHDTFHPQMKRVTPHNPFHISLFGYAF